MRHRCSGDRAEQDKGQGQGQGRGARSLARVEYVGVLQHAECVKLLPDQADHIVDADDGSPAVTEVLVNHDLHVFVDRRVLGHVPGLVGLAHGGVVRGGARRPQIGEQGLGPGRRSPRAQNLLKLIRFLLKLIPCLLSLFRDYSAYPR